MKLKIKEGTTSKLIRIFVQDSAATDGSGKTGIAYNASGLTAAYMAEGDATATQITLASGTTGTYSSGGWSEVDSTLMPGIYEVGLPDACVDATSEGTVLVMFQGAADMAPVPCEIELDAVDYQNADSFGLSRLNVAVSTRNSVAPDNTSITDILNSLPTNLSLLDITAQGAVLQQLTAEAIHLYLTSSNRNDSYKADVSGLSTFNPATDAVANVTTVGSVTGAVTTDAASRTASQADVSLLATAASVSDVDTVVDANKVILDKLDAAMEADGAVHRFTTNALEQAPTGSGGGGGQAGSGAIEHEITVNVGGSPEAGVDVWVSTDAAGSNVVAGTLVTDAFGNVTFSLDAGSYYLWAQKAGVNFTNPTSFTVS